MWVHVYFDSITFNYNNSNQLVNFSCLLELQFVYGFKGQYLKSFCFQTKPILFMCLSHLNTSGQCPKVESSGQDSPVYTEVLFCSLSEHLFLPGFFLHQAAQLLPCLQLGSQCLLFRSNWWQIHTSFTSEYWLSLDILISSFIFWSLKVAVSPIQTLLKENL